MTDTVGLPPMPPTVQNDDPSSIAKRLSDIEQKLQDMDRRIHQTDIPAGTIKPRQIDFGSATGDLPYRDANGLFAALGIGSAGQYLSIASGIPAWATIAAPAGLTSKTGTFSRVLTTASGSQAITGVGFQPTALLCFASVTATQAFSASMTDSGKASLCILKDDSAGLLMESGNKFFYYSDAAGNVYDGIIASFDSDGFTITWTKTSSPTKTAVLNYIAYK